MCAKLCKWNVYSNSNFDIFRLNFLFAVSELLLMDFEPLGPVRTNRRRVIRVTAESSAKLIRNFYLGVDKWDLFLHDRSQTFLQTSDQLEHPLFGTR